MPTLSTEMPLVKKTSNRKKKLRKILKKLDLIKVKVRNASKKEEKKVKIVSKETSKAGRKVYVVISKNGKKAKKIYIDNSHISNSLNMTKDVVKQSIKDGILPNKELLIGVYVNGGLNQKKIEATALRDVRARTKKELAKPRLKKAKV